MENRRNIILKPILGGALLGAFLLAVMPVFAYEQNNTHPALTANIVDFYNLSLSGRELTYQEKRWLIQGSINEDNGVRMLYHFYDPVHDRGLAMVAGASSKNWGLAINFQANVLGRQYAGFSSVFSDGSKADYSYQRALDDYAKGDRERAFVAFGHILHLLEDAGVPDHTRDDPHPPILDLGSPYEHEMAKWNPDNFQIARALFLRREKPVFLNSMEGYLNRVAKYSNNNFFSKDTIFVDRYNNPTVDLWNYEKVGKIEKVVGYKINSTDKYVLVELIFPASLYKISNISTLDGYWDRLSKEVVISGAGALKLFLEEAEKAKKEYLAKQEQKKPSLWAQIAGLFGFGGDNEELITSDGRGISDVDDDELSTRPTSQVGNLQSGDNGDTSGDKKVSPNLSPLSPSMSPLPLVTPLVSPESTPKPINDIECPQGIQCQQRTSDVKTTGKVVINEIAWAGTMASANDEWIELYNTENYDIDLSGWTLKAEDGTPEITIGGNNSKLAISDDQRTSDVNFNMIIKAQGYLLLERTNDIAVNNIAADQLYTGALGNEGELLRLNDAVGTVVDTAGNSGGSWPAGSSTGKISMERISSSTLLGVNWKNFTGNPSAKDANGNFIYGTPKAPNSQVTYVVTGGGGGGSSSSPTPTPSPSPTPTHTPAPTPTPSPEPEGDTANPGDVLINEIAWMGTSAENGHLCEWIELRNMTGNAINLAGWGIYEQGGDALTLSLTSQISPNGYYLIERVTNSCPDPMLGVNDDAGIFGGNGLANTGENLVLKDTSSIIVDQVDGSNEWKINGGSKIIGNNATKETAQRMESSWVTASPTPKAQNSANTAQAPSIVTDLAAVHSSPTINVTWTAPDPGGYNTASLSYDMHYSPTSFSDAASASWWSAATQVASSSLPNVSEKGASQSASFNVVYEYGQTLYFALKTKVIHISTCDVDCPQGSGVSNVASVSFSSAIDAGAWAMFGKDQYHTSFANIAGPGLMATISWEFDAGLDNVVSQPVVSVDGNIYFGAANGSFGKLIKLDKNGIKSWEYPTNVSIGMPAVLSDGTVYFGRIGAGGMLAFTTINSDGSNKWDYNGASKVQSVTVSSKGEPHFTYTSGTDKLVVLNTDGSVKTMIGASGLSGFAPVILGDGTIITAGRISGNQVFAAYSSGGDQIWQVFYTGANGSVPADPSHDKSTGITYSAAGSKLFNIPSNGSILNFKNIAPWDYTAATTVAISADTLYVGFNGPYLASGSLLYALNKADLTTKWSFRADSHINKQIAVDKNGGIYFSTQSGKLYSVDSVGNQRWIINSGLNSTVSPVMTERQLIWGYRNKVVLISD